MRISVRFFTILREITGKREEILEFQDGTTVTVNEVLVKLAQIYGKGFAEYVYDRNSGQLRSFLQLLVNGRSASTLEGLNTRLVGGDVLAIVPPVGGG